MPENAGKWTGWHTFALLAILIAIALVGLLPAQQLGREPELIAAGKTAIVAALKSEAARKLAEGNAAGSDESKKAEQATQEADKAKQGLDDAAQNATLWRRFRLASWLGTVVLLLAFTIVAGHGVVGLWSGLLIDERNRMCLSRLQMILWTIVVLSGFLTAAFWNIAAGLWNLATGDVLAIAVPSALWLAMGISTTSLVGSPLIKSTKTDRPSNSNELARNLAIAKAQGIPSHKYEAHGHNVGWQWPADARWADLFSGEEVGNFAHLDLGKVQMLYFTLILVLAYAVLLGSTFLSSEIALSSLPELAPSMVALLGISHAGYLTNKAASHSQSPKEPPPAPPNPAAPINPPVQAAAHAQANAPAPAGAPALAIAPAQPNPPGQAVPPGIGG